VTEATVRIDADRERCIGAGMCALTAPDVFDQDEDDGLVVVRRHRPRPEDLNAVQQALMLCPSGALSLHEVDE
jgi:ferredoxin